jgi:hypothetical protein
MEIGRSKGKQDEWGLNANIEKVLGITSRYFYVQIGK